MHDTLGIAEARYSITRGFSAVHRMRCVPMLAHSRLDPVQPAKTINCLSVHIDVHKFGYSMVYLIGVNLFGWWQGFGVHRKTWVRVLWWRSVRVFHFRNNGGARQLRVQRDVSGVATINLGAGVRSIFMIARAVPVLLLSIARCALSIPWGMISGMAVPGGIRSNWTRSALRRGDANHWIS
jgi:hypothetical protein